MTDDDPGRFRPPSTRVVPRFAGVPTFLRLPSHGDPADLDVMICGAPFDGGTTYRPGARFGPRGVRMASALSRGFHPGPRVDIFERLRCADGGDVPCVPMDTERSIAAIEARDSDVARAEADRIDRNSGAHIAFEEAAPDVGRGKGISQLQVLEDERAQ